MKKYSFLVAVCMLGWSNVNAQVSEFGDVSMDELTMERYEADTSAAAVVLFESGRMTFDRWFRPEMEYHVRIKILDESAFDHATIQVRYNPEIEQGIAKIKGATYNLGEQGEMVTSKLNKKDIFKEDYIGNVKTTKFTLPSLSAGSVIEYSYVKKYGWTSNLPDWVVQRDIPVIWSELNMRERKEHTFKTSFAGAHPFAIQDSEPNKGNVDHRWVAKDVPGIKREPFINSLDNYRSRILFQTESIGAAGDRPVDLLLTWGRIYTGLKELYSQAEKREKEKFYKEEAAKLIGGLSTDEEKMAAIFDYVSKTYKWNGAHNIITYGDFKKVRQKKEGDSVDINFILMRMLKSAGIGATPVVISTRAHGLINKDAPFIDQFNSVIILARADGKEFFLDASMGPRSYKMLPEKDINGAGMEIHPLLMKWVDISLSEPTKDVYMVEASVTPDAIVSGKVSASMTGYFAQDFRVDMNKAEDHKQHLRKDLFDGFAGVVIDELEVKDIEDYSKPMVYTSEFSNLRGDNIKVSGDFIYMNPMLFMSDLENPFKESERTLPVNFVNTFSTRYIANIKIPEGYEVDELPKPKAFSLPDKAATFRRVVSTKDGMVTVLFDQRLNKTDFPIEEYEQLRGLFREIVESNNERVVFKKVREIANEE